MQQQQTQAEWKSPALKLEDIVRSSNLVKAVGEKAAEFIGREAVQGYEQDLRTRADWDVRMAEAMKLALQVREVKNFPWTKASNIKFPALTIAALQFLARVSLMTKGRNLAKLEFVGPDPEGKRAAQAMRLGRHLSLQLKEESPNWSVWDEEMKLACAIMGAAFKKTVPDVVQGITTSEHVAAKDFVVDFFAKSLDDAARLTHVIPMSANALQERVRRGHFEELVAVTSPAPSSSALAKASDEASGMHQTGGDSAAPVVVLEQHCWLDLDNDGYKEPYIVAVVKDTAQVLRIVARFNDGGDVFRLNDTQVRKLDEASFAEQDMQKKAKLEQESHALVTAKGNHIVRIVPMQYFTRYLFIPSPDGSIYGLGLGALIGPLNESINALVNQLVDAGTMSNTAGGFLGRGVKMKGGTTTFNPFEWKVVDSSGNDLKSNIFPLPVREPSNVLFQLLGLLVTHVEKVSGSTDIMTGVSPGQNTPAETSRNTVEQGMMLFSGIYNRMHGSFREELRKFYTFNRLFLAESPRYFDLVKGQYAILMDDDYKSGQFYVFPSASAEAASQSQLQDKAKMVLQLAGTTPGFNRYIATRNVLEAYEIANIDEVFPDPTGPKAIAPPKDPKIALAEAQLKEQVQQHSDEMQLQLLQMQQDVQLTEAKIEELKAKAEKFRAEAAGVETGHQIALLDAQIGAANEHKKQMVAALGLIHKMQDAQAKHAKELAQAKEPTKGPAQPAAAPQP